MLALGLLEILPTMAQYAAHKLLTLCPILGIPLYRSDYRFSTSHAGAALTKEHRMTVKISQRCGDYGAWQYSGAGLINNYFSIGSALLPH